MRKRTLTLMLPLVAPFAGCSTLVTSPPAECSQFIPDSWREPIPGAPLPTGMDARAWMAFGIEQSGQLDKSNGRTADILHIVGQCEMHSNKARARGKWLGVF